MTRLLPSTNLTSKVQQQPRRLAPKAHCIQRLHACQPPPAPISSCKKTADSRTPAQASLSTQHGKLRFAKRGMHRGLCRLEDVTSSLARCQGATRSCCLAFFVGRLALFLNRLELILDAAEFGLHLVVGFVSSPRLEYNVGNLGLLVHLFLQCLDCPMFVLAALSACPHLHVVGDCGMAFPFCLPEDWSAASSASWTISYQCHFASCIYQPHRNGPASAELLARLHGAVCLTVSERCISFAPNPSHPRGVCCMFDGSGLRAGPLPSSWWVSGSCHMLCYVGNGVVGMPVYHYVLSVPVNQFLLAPCNSLRGTNTARSKRRLGSSPPIP